MPIAVRDLARSETSRWRHREEKEKEKEKGEGEEEKGEGEGEGGEGQGEGEGQEAPYKRLTPDHPPLAASTGSNSNSNSRINKKRGVNPPKLGIPKYHIII